MKGMEFDMAGEIEFFRKRFVGGFNREDVVNYISKLAQERNDWREAKEKADQDAHALTDEIARLILELEKARNETREAREYKVKELESAEIVFSKLEAGFKNLCIDMETATENISAEFDKARGIISALPAFLEDAGTGLKALQTSCASEKETVICSLNDNDNCAGDHAG